jgi:hypothetical protein
MRLRALGLCLLWAALCASPELHAQDLAPEAPAPSALPLTLSLTGSKLDPETIRRAIELELKRPVSLTKPGSAASGNGATQSLSVVVHADHTVSVSYHAADGVTRTRSLGLPQDDARSPEVIALLSGNLSRDEAAELLADLAARANTPTSASPDASATPTTPEPPKPPEPSAPPARKPTPAPVPKPVQKPAPDELLRLPYPAFDLSLVHPISLIPRSERYLINGELGLVYSHIGALSGVGLNVMVLRTERYVHGISYATFYNAYGDLRGCAVTGVANLGRDLDGCTVAGVVNQARDGRGIQVAGFVNIAGKLRGLQLSGVTNIAQEIAGAQIGLVNVAGEVHGLQIGLVNVAKHVDGASFGLVSMAGNGRVQPVLWASTVMPVNAALKFTVGSFYTQLGAGYTPSDQTYSYEVGLGAHLPIGSWFVEPGVHYSEQRDPNRVFSDELNENLHYRLAVGLDLHAVSPFIGAAVLHRFAHAIDVPDSHPVAVEAFGGLAFF